jgi:hypothetical protein
MEFRKVNFENTEIVVPILDKYNMSSNIYLEEIQFVSFFDKLLYSMSSQYNAAFVCLNNNIYERQRQKMNIPTVLENFLHVDLASFKAKIAIESVNYINKNCTDKALIFLPIKLGFLTVQKDYNNTFDINEMINFSMKNIEIFNEFDKADYHEYHSNLLIIDNVNKRIEYFEPHGVISDHLSAKLVNLQSIIFSLIKDLFPFTNTFDFRNASATCLYGVQNLQGSVNTIAGHCLAWSLFFLWIRLINFTIKIQTSESISEFLHRFLTMKYKPIELDAMIKRYITFINQLPATSKSYAKNYHIDMTSYIDIIDKINIEDRCATLANVYFEKLLSYSFKDIGQLFEELSSYRRLPSFHTIMNQSLIKMLRKNNNEVNLDPDLMSPFFSG